MQRLEADPVLAQPARASGRVSKMDLVTALQQPREFFLSGKEPELVPWAGNPVQVEIGDAPEALVPRAGLDHGGEADGGLTAAVRRTGLCGPIRLTVKWFMAALRWSPQSDMPRSSRLRALPRASQPVARSASLRGFTNAPPSYLTGTADRPGQGEPTGPATWRRPR